MPSAKKLKTTATHNPRVLPRKGIVKRYSFDPELSDFQRAFANAGAATFTWGG
jgi:hypothetical protein